MHLERGIKCMKLLLILTFPKCSKVKMEDKAKFSINFMTLNANKIKIGQLIHYKASL